MRTPRTGLRKEPFLPAALTLALVLTAAAAAAGPGAPEPEASASRKEVTFANGNVTLSASLLLPKREGRSPAIVFLHGSGSESRAVFEAVAARFAGSGVAALIFDKRGCGKSSGSWIESSLDDLAGDGAAAVRFLADRPEIDPRRIGLLAVSQSGWYAPLVAERAPVASLIAVSGGGGNPRETEWQFYEDALNRNNVSGEDRRRARELVRHYLDYLATGEGYGALQAEIAEAKKAAWYAAVPVERVLPSESNRKNWAWIATFNPSLSIERLHVPVLLFFGGKDEFAPPHALEAWTAALSRSTARATIRSFPEAGHGMVLGDHPGSHDPAAPHRWAVGYVETAIAWFQGLP